MAVSILFSTHHAAAVAQPQRGPFGFGQRGNAEQHKKIDTRFADLAILPVSAPVAQLDRASGFEPEGRGFKSCRGYHILALYGFYKEYLEYTQKRIANRAYSYAQASICCALH